MSMVVRGLFRGAAAGAAGTTALNAVSGVDAAVRGRPASEAPRELVAAVADKAGVKVPGDRKERANRVAALGPLTGTVSGVALGAMAGALRAIGVRLPTVLGGPLLGAAAMVAADGPLALAKISGPRSWSAADWTADVVPHLAYGVVTHRTLVSLSRDRDGSEPVAPLRMSTLLRAAALGTATGGRSSAGVTALALTSKRGDTGAVSPRLGTVVGRITTGGLAATEVVLDKQPAIPPRTSGQGMAPRVALGATVGGAVASRAGDDPDLPALVGAASAVAGSLAGIKFRAAAHKRFGSDLPGALIEDAVCVLFGWLGARRHRPTDQ